MGNGTTPSRMHMGSRVALHHVHSITANKNLAADALPQNFIGEHSSLTIDLLNQMLRVHDEVTPGGIAYLPLYRLTAGQNPAPAWPFTPLQYGTPAAPVAVKANNAFTVTHNLGRFPLVQVIDAATGQVVDATIVHDLTMNSLQIAVSVAGNYIIVVQ